MTDVKPLTANFGSPVGNDLNTMTAGRGQALRHDRHLLEEPAHFDRERIPGRVVQAKGAGAYGYFEDTHDVRRDTTAKFLAQGGKQTDLFVRFSTVGGKKGSAASEGVPCGFAIKFYTEADDCDMVGTYTPVFFIRAPLTFPDFIHTQKRNPATSLKDGDMFWDFFPLTPGSIHQVTVLFSDRRAPRNWRCMNGYSSHTCKWYSQTGDYVLVQYHFKTEQGIANFSGEEADWMRAMDPGCATPDVDNAITSGQSPMALTNAAVATAAPHAAY